MLCSNLINETSFIWNPTQYQQLLNVSKVEPCKCEQGPLHLPVDINKVKPVNNEHPRDF